MNVIKKILLLLVQCIISIEILIFIGTLPYLFSNLSINLKIYMLAVWKVTYRLFTFQPFMFNGKISLFPFIFDRYLDSMRILGLSIFAATIGGFLFAYMAILFFGKKINFFIKCLELAETIPDIVFILLLQMVVIVIYQKTGIRLAQVISLQKKIVLLPVISIALPISFYMTKVIIYSIKEELEKNYVTLVKAKGFSNVHILNVHVLRNITESLLGTSKTIFWSMMSTLLIVEYMFNMNGLFQLMLTGSDPFIIGCIMIFIPFFFLYRIYEWVSFQRRKDTK